MTMGRVENPKTHPLPSLLVTRTWDVSIGTNNWLMDVQTKSKA